MLCLLCRTSFEAISSVLDTNTYRTIHQHDETLIHDFLKMRTDYHSNKAKILAMLAEFVAASSSKK
jgi:hypothetical protein